MKAFKNNRKLYVQAVEYMVSGGVYFWVGYLLLDLFYYVWDWSLWWSTIISSIIGWAVNYALQYYWVFKSPTLKEHQTRTTSRYIIITVADWIINYLILAALQSINITPAIGQFISAAFFTVWNYLWYRFWVFPDQFAKKAKVKTTPLRLVAHRAHGHSAYRV